MSRFVLIALLLIFKSAVYADECKRKVAAEVSFCAPKIEVLKNITTAKDLKKSDLKGKVVFLHFWATWCKPCAEELPALKSLYEAIDPNKVVFLPVSIDKDGKPAVDRFFKRLFKGEYPNFDVYLDAEQQLAKKYGTIKVPETFIINKKGEITDKLIGKRNWDDSIIKNYLKLLSQ